LTGVGLLYFGFSTVSLGSSWQKQWRLYHTVRKIE